MNKKFWIKKIIGCIIIALAVGALLGYVVMALWNNVLAEVLHVPFVSFWQAIGLLILSKILFGGIKGRWGGGDHCGGGWKNKMREKWHAMTPEEREKLKEEWMERCRKR